MGCELWGIGLLLVAFIGLDPANLTHQTSLRKFGYVANQDAFAPEIDEVGFSEVVEYRGDCLAAGAGQAGDVGLRKVVFDEGFHANLVAFFAGRIYEELDDAFACIFRHEVGEAFFCALHPKAQVAKHSKHQGGVFLHQVVEIGKGDGEEFCVVE